MNNYVVFNYLEQTWYYGTLSRTTWLDSGCVIIRWLQPSNNLVNHEEGTDDNESGTPAAITATITSGQFDLDDGDRFAFIWRIMPDVTFDGSTAASPAATISLLPLANSGSGYKNPLSESGANSGAVTRAAIVPVEEFWAGMRVRGRRSHLGWNQMRWG